MDFHLDDDQLALQESIADFCRARWPLDGVAERPEGPLDRAAWQEIVDLGVPSLMVGEDDGGLGLGVVEAAVVFEQLGRHLVPGPLVWSALGALLVPEVARGEWTAGGTVADGDGPFFVEHAADVDTLVLLRADGVARVDRTSVDPALPAEPLDPHAGVGVLTTLPPGERVGDAGDATRLRRAGTVLTAALQLGVAQSALDVSVAYALEREQFGVPIGSFQALKHMMADMYVRTLLARSATWAAAAVLDDPDVGDADRSIAAAKLLAGEAAVDNARASIQIFGGMGFTWEMPPNFLVKRALALDHAFGSPTTHALALGAALEEEVA